MSNFPFGIQEMNVSNSNDYFISNIEDALELCLETGIITLEIEKSISNSSYYSYHYARQILLSRFELGEKAISNHSYYSYHYAKQIIKGMWKLGESAISKDLYYSYWYAIDLKKRFKPAEVPMFGKATYDTKVYCYYALQYNHE